MTMQSSDLTSGSAPRKSPAASASPTGGGLPVRGHGGEAEAAQPGLERLGEIAAGVSPEGSREDEGRSREELRAGRRSQARGGPGDAPCGRDQGKDRQEDEERVGGGRGRDRVESAGRPQEGDLHEALAEAVPGEPVAPFARDGVGELERDPELAVKGEGRPGREHLLAVRNHPERPLVGRREKRYEDEEGRGERGARAESGQDGCHRSGDCRVSVLTTCGPPDASFGPCSGPVSFRASSRTRCRGKRPAEAAGGRDTGPPRQLSSAP